MRAQHGLTLIELLITVAILAILMTIGIPSFQDFFAANRVSTVTGDLMAHLNLARSEAIRRSATVTVQRIGGSSKNWDGGWQVYQDQNSDGTADANEIIKVYSTLPSNVTLRTNTAYGDRLRFSASGRVLGVGAGGGSFFVCHGDHASAAVKAGGRAIVVTAMGRARVDQGVASCAP